MSLIAHNGHNARLLTLCHLYPALVYLSVPYWPVLTQQAWLTRLVFTQQAWLTRPVIPCPGLPLMPDSANNARQCQQCQTVPIMPDSANNARQCHYGKYGQMYRSLVYLCGYPGTPWLTRLVRHPMASTASLARCIESWSTFIDTRGHC